MKKFFAIFTVVTLAVTAIAQQLDHPVTIPVSFYGTAVSGSTTSNFTIAITSAGQATGASTQGGGTPFSGPVSSANMIPAKVYHAVVTSSGCSVVQVHFDPTPSQRIFINGLNTTTLTQGANYAFDVRVEYLNDPTSSAPGGESLAGKPGGQSSSFPEDKPIWYIGLGTLRDGRFAGAVGIRAAAVTSNLFNSSSLIYDSVDGWAVTTTYDSNNYITEIDAHEIVLKVDPYNANGTQYSIRGYSPSDLVTPFVTYTISQCTVAGVGGIRIDRLEDGVNWSMVLTNAGSNWTRYNWQRMASTSTAFDPNTAVTSAINGSSETVTYGSGSDSIVKTKTFAGSELASVTWGTGIAPAQSTSYTYYTSATGTGWPSAQQSATEATGSWVKYDYYNDTTQDGAPGTLFRVYRPWKDAPSDMSGASTTNSYVDTYKYTASYDGTKTAASELVTTLNGTQIGKTTWAYNWSYGSANQVNTAQIVETNYTGVSTFVATTTVSYRPDVADSTLRGRPHSVVYPTGRKDSYAYFGGIWDSGSKTFTGGNGTDHMVLCLHGQISGGTTMSTYTSGTVAWSLDPVNMLTGYSTASETVVDATGRTVFTGELAYNSGSLELIGGTAYTYDAHGRVLRQTDAIRTSYTQHDYTAYASGNFSFVEATTAPDGVVTKHCYDGFLRLDTTIIGDGAANPNYPAKTQQTVYNVANLPKKTYTCSCGTSPVVLEYDNAGRLTTKYEKSPNDPNNDTTGTLVTRYTYPTATSKLTQLPTGATQAEDYYLDGRAKSVTGTAVAPRYWSYDVNTTGILIKQTANGSTLDNGGSITQFDYLNRVVKHSAPAFGYNSSAAPLNVVDVTSTYDDATNPAAPKTGNLIRRRTTYQATSDSKLLPDELFTYDSGRLTTTGADINEDGALTAASNDRITTYDQKFMKDGTTGIWSSVSDTWQCGVLGSAASTLVSEAKTQLTGLSASTVAIIGSTDARGRTVNSTTTVDAANKRVTTQTTAGGVANSAYSTTENGYESTAQSPTGEQVRKTYDSYGRLYQVKSRGTGSSYASTDTTYTSTDTYGYYGATQYVNSATIGGTTSSFTYAWGTNGARTVTTTDTYGNSSYILYNAMGLPLHVGGSAANAVAFTYDTFGHRTDLTTYRDATHTEADWPTGGDTTHWELDAATGAVKEKRLADYASTSRKTAYTYTALGQLKTRAWARLNAQNAPVTTTYAYYDGSTGATSDVSFRTQELSGVTYNDGTQAVSLTYKRSGLAATLGDAAGTHTFAYQANPFVLNTETFDATFYNARVQTRNYDGLMRDTGYSFGTELSQAALFASGTGLLDHIDSASGSNRTYTYGYKAATAMVDNYATGSFKASYDYDSTSAARRTRVEGDWSTTAISRFDLTYEGRGLVQSEKQSGTAFDDYYTGLTYNSTYNWYSYDPRGQLQTVIMYRGTPPTSGAPASADQLPGRRFEYRYDGSGNRTTAGSTGSSASGDNVYVPNALNQYLSKESNNVKLLGTAPSNAAMSATSSGTTGSGIIVTRLDRSFSADAAPANVSGAAKGTMSITASQGGVNTSTDRDWLIGAQNQTYQYDEDGNLKNDGLWLYTYDAENRLKRMTSQLPSGQGFTRLQLDFKYDYLGRRIEKIVTNLDTSQVTFARRFLYDGWNLVAELNSVGTTILRTYTWGLDIGHSLNQVGSAGALVGIADRTTGKTYFPTYDANGNVSTLVDSSDGSIAAIYEYGPFGELLHREEPTGGYAKQNPFRFSTKYTDEETGLAYYGYRYYSPTLGRFINRDPAAEGGGINLYAIVGNSPVNATDTLGLWKYCWDSENWYEDSDGKWHYNIGRHCVDIPDGDYSFGGPNYYVPSAPLGSRGGGGAGGVSGGPGGTQASTDPNDPNCHTPCCEAKRALAAAQNAGATYNDSAPAEDWMRVDPTTLGISARTLFDAQSGFGAAIFRNVITGELQMGLRGTDDATNDKLTDAGQAIGMTMAQYTEATSAATALVQYAIGRGIKISFTGHSLGGGEVAKVMSYYGVAGYSAYTFNAAGLHPFSSFRSSGLDRIQAFYVDGDPLHFSQAVLPIPAADGQRIKLQGDGSFVSGTDHRIATVVGALKQRVVELCK